MRLTAPCLLLPALALCSALAAEPAPPDPVVLDAKPLDVESRIDAVTLYLGRASVTRLAELNVTPGAYALRFDALPAGIQPHTLQARGIGPAKVIGVEFEQQAVAESAAPRLVDLDRRIEETRVKLAHLREQQQLNASQAVLVDRISVRVGDDASRDGGTDKLDLEALRRQIAFVAEQRETLMTTREQLERQGKELDGQLRVLQAQRDAVAGPDQVSRAAVVTVAVTAASPVTVELTYLVGGATWEPSYNVRAAADGGGASIEYNAVLQQRSGEDWTNVRLTLSTAQPTLAANPPELQPWFVDVLKPRRTAPASEGLSSNKYDMAVPVASPQRADRNNRAFVDDQDRAWKDAVVSGGGPSVTFLLPRTVTVKSDDQKRQSTRIAAIDTPARFIHVAVPALTEAVYLRGELTNAGDHQLLPGAASIFVGQDYIGPTTMPSVVPRGTFDVHFGIDQAVRATRQLVSKKTSKTGLFNGGVRAAYDYRLSIDNGTGKAIDVELWDRKPVSQSDRIKADVADMSKPLAADTKYLEQQQQGLLKWVLNIPAGATGTLAETITYGVRIDHAADVETTPLPE
jgi:uncharacterized protein (TIGR02231 family)